MGILKFIPIFIIIRLEGLKLIEKPSWSLNFHIFKNYAFDYQKSDGDYLGDQGSDFKSGFVSIIGNPNMGKSTLLNAILRQDLCIVSPKPQTTRHRILGVLSQPQYQIAFSDTPGMVEPAYMLQETMMEAVRGASVDADVIVLLTDLYGEPLVDKTIFTR